MIVKTTMHVHRSKDSNYHEFLALWEAKGPPESLGGPSTDAAARFLYAGYEIGLDVEVDLLTGAAKVTGIEGIPLAEPKEIS